MFVLVCVSGLTWKHSYDNECDKVSILNNLYVVRYKKTRPRRSGANVPEISLNIRNSPLPGVLMNTILRIEITILNLICASLVKVVNRSIHTHTRYEYSYNLHKGTG